MKIAIATGPFHPLPPGPAGAVERLTYDLALRFAARGHEVTLLSRAWPGAPRDETRDGITHLRRLQLTSTPNVYVNIVKDLPYSLAMARLLPPADIWLVNAFWLPALALLRRRSHGARIVVAAHRYPKGQFRLYRGVDRITSVSTAVARAIVAQAPWSAPIVRVIPNPIDTSAFTPVTRDFSAPPVLVYTGRLHPEKGLEILIRAVTRLAPSHPGLRLRIVGPWHEAQGGGGAAYFQSLRTLAGDGPVTFHAPILDRRQLAAELQAAHVFVYPSVAEKGESFGVAPLEGMATGLVAVVSALECFEDYLVDGHTGLVFDHRDSEPDKRLAERLASLLRDPALMARLSLAGAARARDFAYDRIVDLHLEDYRSLLSQTHKSPQ